MSEAYLLANEIIANIDADGIRKHSLSRMMEMMDEAKKSFKPEFLNLLTEIVIFKPLAKESMHSIVELELKKVSDRLIEKKLKLDVTDEAKEFLIEKGYDEKFGARPLKRAIQKYIEDPLAEEIINSNLQEGDTIVLDFETGGDVLKLSIEKAKPSKKKADPKAE